MNERNYEVVAVVKRSISEDDRKFILEKIDALKQRLHILQEGDTFYKKRLAQYDDFGPCVTFFLKLNTYKEYFELLEYNSYLEGVLHGTV